MQNREVVILNSKQAIAQPMQLDLFRVLADPSYSNVSGFYQSLPDTVPWSQDYLRNGDGFANSMIRQFSYGKSRNKYTLKIAPSLLKKTTDEKERSYFKWPLEEVVERAIHKLTVDNGYFYGNTERITLVTTLYQIKRELDQYGKKYSYQQIRDALDVLSSMTYFIEGKELNEEGKMTVSPIQYSYYNPNTTKDKHGAKAKLKISLNELVTQDILQRKWRQVGYKNIMQDRSFLGRYLRERLYLRYIQASPTEPYSFMVSSLVYTEWVMKEYPDFQDNIKNVVRTLKSMDDILSKFEIDPRTEINPDTKRKKVIDAKITVYGSEYFQNEQIKINAHHRRLDNAVVTQSGEYLIEPRVNEELNATEYLKKRDKYNKLKAGQ